MGVIALGVKRKDGGGMRWLLQQQGRGLGGHPAFSSPVVSNHVALTEHQIQKVLLSSFPDYSVFNSQQVQDEVDTKSLDDMEQSLLVLSETKAPAMSNTALWKKQVSTIAKVHFLSLKRENKCVRVM